MFMNNELLKDKIDYVEANITEELKKRNLPKLLEFNDGTKVKDINDWIKRREEIKKILINEEYGWFLKEQVKIVSKNIKTDLDYCGGSAIFYEEELTLIFDKGSFSFPIRIAIPKTDKKTPAFIYLDFYSEFPNKNLPVEEICDKGFAIISLCYKDIVSDDDDFSNDICKYLADKNIESFGKISVWAWGASHVMDYILTLDRIDSNNIAIVGHSRLGKTALLTGAMDERFKYVISNNSGQSGIALSRGKTGEKTKDIYMRFPYWFSTNYEKYINNENYQPFDQHYLASLIAPRYLYISSASEDDWADPKSEFLCCIATNPVYELLGEKGFIHENRYPLPGDKLHQGNIGYHLRKGTHYLGRYDWNRFMDYIKSKIY